MKYIHIYMHTAYTLGLPRCSAVKNPPVMQEMRVRSPGQEDPLEKVMATHFSVLAWKLARTEESGGPQPTRSQRVGHEWACTHTSHTQYTYVCMYIYICVYAIYIYTYNFKSLICYALRKMKVELLGEHWAWEISIWGRLPLFYSPFSSSPYYFQQPTSLPSWLSSHK